MVTVNRLDIITFTHNTITLTGQVMSCRFTFQSQNKNVAFFYVVTERGAEFLVQECNIVTARPMPKEAKGI